MMIKMSLQPSRHLKRRVKSAEDSYWKDVVWIKNRSCVLRLLIENCKKQQEKACVRVLLPELLPESLGRELQTDGVELLHYPLTDAFDPDWNMIKDTYKETEVDVFLFVHYFGVYHDANRAKTFCKQHEALLVEDASHCLYDYQKIGQAGDYTVYSSENLLAGHDVAWIVAKDELIVPQEWAVSASDTRDVMAYSYEDLKRIAYQRRENLSVLNYYMNQFNNTIRPMVMEECECPLFAVYSLSDVVNREKTLQELAELNMSMQYLSDQLIAFPIHQDIKPEVLAKRVRKCVSVERPNIFVKRIDESERFRWDALYNQFAASNIPQHWAYGDMKNEAEGWNVERFIITKDETDIGILQLLSKSILGRKVAYRLNRGPIFLEKQGGIDVELEAVHQLRKLIQRPSAFFYVPYSVMTPENYIKTINANWKNWDIFGYPSGVVDLTQSEEDLRKSLNSKWRNQLKTAEKYGHEIMTDNHRFEEMMRLYAEEQQEKGFKGENPGILRAMYNHPEQPLRFFYVEDEQGVILAYDIFYRHAQVATYFIGWNSEEGRKQCLNNLLLYQAAVHLKEEGVETLDLGGIEYIQTEAVAKFKDGMTPKHYRQMGEFYKIG